MNIRPATDDDALRWDDFVAAHPLASPYHSWAWKKSLEDSYRLTTLYYLAENSNQQLEAIMPVAQVPRPLGSGPLCALPYCDRGEPLASSASAYTQIIDGWLKAHAGPVELRGTKPEKEPQLTDPNSPLKFKQSQKVRLLLKLPDTAEALLAGFKSKHRSQINKARKNGLTASVGNSPEFVDAFYEVFTRNMRDLGSPTHSLRWFKAIASHYGADCMIGLVKLRDHVVGGGIVLMTGTQAAIPWASTLREHNRLAPNMLLYWALLEAVIQRGGTHFDFGRSNYGEGTYRFKTQWGAQPVALDWQKVAMDGLTQGNDLSAQQTKGLTSGTLRRAIESTWRHLPLPVTVALGSQLRPWISL